VGLVDYRVGRRNGAEAAGTTIGSAAIMVTGGGRVRMPV